LLTRYCTDLVGGEGRLASLSLRVRRFAVAGEDLTVAATVTAVTEAAADLVSVYLDLTETRGSDGEICVTGNARIDVPLAWAAQTTTSGEASR